MYNKCKECEDTLWSMYSQEKGICSECEGQEENERLDVEDELEILLENA